MCELSLQVGAAAKVERAKRREDNLATVRKQEQQAKDYAAQVRFETRPDVRRVTREHFKARRDYVCEKERQKQEQDRQERQRNLDSFMSIRRPRPAQTPRAPARARRNRTCVSRSRRKNFHRSRRASGSGSETGFGNRGRSW